MSSIDREFPQDETSPHRELIMSLLTLAGFLTDHPELPICNGRDDLTIRLWPEYPNHEPPTDSQYVAWVREMARAFDVEPYWNTDRTHFYAVRKFGDITVQAIAILRKVMDEARLKDELGEKAFAELQAKEATAAGAVDEGQADVVPSIEEGQADEAPAVEPGRVDVDERAFAEVDCADCDGVGYDEERHSCPTCLGKGAVFAPSLQPAAQTVSGGMAW